MKPFCQQTGIDKNEGFILVKDKALVRGIFSEACFRKKEKYK